MRSLPNIFVQTLIFACIYSRVMATRKSASHIDGACDFAYCKKINREYVEFSPREMDAAAQKTCSYLYSHRGGNRLRIITKWRKPQFKKYIGNLFQIPAGSELYQAPLQKSGYSDLHAFVIVEWNSQNPPCKVLGAITVTSGNNHEKCLGSAAYQNLNLEYILGLDINQRSR
ncbi:hypothetical protein GcC1_217029 [Golovinomyces cichoracearum]|uniref:Secreted effector protein n=1 Tax=Golovinomyces cichoracearum TaxID=62708 RepID=A0A420H8Z1_9PEZI|nr:hypothetical protein GcC1_217029 [Golovinomyces cichoracearum]